MRDGATHVILTLMLSEKVIEEYQLILMREPAAKVFAPLAESYRKMGLLQQALEICEKGVKYNPEYPSGLVALGKILFELKRYDEASRTFKKAITLKPDNILAHKLNALSLIKLNQYSEALKSYKYVLFLSPEDEAAQKFISTWEYLEAQNYSEKAFPPSEDSSLIAHSQPESVAAFIEALIVRNEIEKAEKYTKMALQKWPDSDVLLHQLNVINEFQSDEAKDNLNLQMDVLQIKKRLLSRLLRRIELARQS